MSTTRPALLFTRGSILGLVTSEKRPCVYRIYLDYDRTRLGYVGATILPRKRLLDHLRSGKPGVVVELQFFRNTTAMARAEREAIASEVPELPCGPGTRHGTWRAQRRLSLESARKGMR